MKNEESNIFIVGESRRETLDEAEARQLGQAERAKDYGQYVTMCESIGVKPLEKNVYVKYGIYGGEKK